MFQHFRRPVSVDISLCALCRYPQWTVASVLSEKELMCDDFDALHSSAQHGCSGCKVLTTAWECALPDPKDRAEEGITFNATEDALYFHLFSQGKVINLDLFTLENTPRFKHIRVASLIPSSTNIEVVGDRVRRWLSECQQQHPRCRATTVSAPERLLDLTAVSTGIVRVIEKSENRVSGGNHHSPSVQQYACLSHCWGKTRSKHLLRGSNYEDNKSGIPIKELPRTFRDAIQICQAIDVQYLWIDSLCIIQDDQGDWEAHVKLMAKIYRDAFITLAAGASEDDDGGFFRQPEEMFTKLHSFTIVEDGDEYPIYIRHCLPHPDESWPTGRRMPLMTRGWVFQERLLSKRFICFARNEVLWECQEDVACSCSTSNTKFNLRALESPPAFMNCLPVRSDFNNLSQLSRKHMLSLWRDLVMHYTERLLTYPSDKIPALAGLAAHFEAAGAGTYLHGLWRESLEECILWENQAFNSQQSRPRPGPSWSWVSAADTSTSNMEGIDWNKGILQTSGWQIAKLPDVTGSTLSASNEHNGYFPLLIKGNLARLRLVYDERSSNMLEAFPSYRDVKGHLATSMVRDTIGPQLPSFAEMEQAQTGCLWTDYKFWTDEPSLWKTLSDITFFELGSEIEREGSPGHTLHQYLWVAGLVLRPVGYEDEKMKETKAYERIGWLRLCTNTTKDRWKALGTETTFNLV